MFSGDNNLLFVVLANMNSDIRTTWCRNNELLYTYKIRLKLKISLLVQSGIDRLYFPYVVIAKASAVLQFLLKLQPFAKSIRQTDMKWPRY